MGYWFHAGSISSCRSLVPLAARAGVPITIMNLGSTQYDYLAERIIREDIAKALPKLVDETIAK